MCRVHAHVTYIHMCMCVYICIYTHIHIYIYLRATPPAAGPLDADSGLLITVLVVGELGTCRPRFSSLRNVLENWIQIKDVLTWRPAPSTEFGRGSCCHSQIGWRPYICKVLPGCVITHFKTPQEYTYCRSALGTWDWGGVGI